MKLFFSCIYDQPRPHLLLLGAFLVNGLSIPTSTAQGPHSTQGGTFLPYGARPPSPDSQFKSLGQASAVDRYVSGGNPQPAIPPSKTLAEHLPGQFTGVRQTAYMQSGFSMPGLGTGANPTNGSSSLDQPALQPLTPGPTPPSLQNPAPGFTAQPVPNTAPPIPNNPANLAPVPRTNSIPSGNNLGLPAGNGYPNSPSDLTPIPTPQLNPNWSTVDNCALISPPSGYRAQFWGCGPVVPAGAIPYDSPQVIVPATVMPGSPVAGNLYAGSVGPKPLFTLGQERNNVSLGQGIIGQPVAYVPGQYFRNFLRYISP